MYLSQIIVENYGAIEKLTIEPKFNASGDPLPLLLVGKNGSGKTLLLANITDSLIEAKRRCYVSLQETEMEKYFKLGSKDYIRFGRDYTYIKLEYKNTNSIEKFVDFTTHLDKESFTERHRFLELDGIDKNNQQLFEGGFLKDFTAFNKNDVKNDFDRNIYSYFPHSRYDVPRWLNAENLGFDFTHHFLGESQTNIVKSNILLEIQKWILDVILDKLINEKRSIPVSNLFRQSTQTPINPVLENLMLDLGYSGKNTITQDLVNHLLTVIYKAKSDRVESARIGISAKNSRKIAIFIKNENEEELVVAPAFSHLSSGEVMLLSIFTSMLKDYDVLNPDKPATNLAEIAGIVLVDEIDLHLHLSFQRKVLPELIALFPKVQFIVTTHSPFLLLGMKEKFGENFQLLNLPDGNEISIDSFSEYKEAFDAFLSLNQNYRTQVEKISEKLNQINKPLLITEGKTDWKHLKKALEKLKATDRFTDLDVEFFEYEDINMGDSELDAICQKLSKIPNHKKTICIFDRDNQEILKKYADESGYKILSNEVFAFCIPVPNHRADHQKISIEHYYRDDEIRNYDENGRRLFLSSEFKPNSGRHVTEQNINYGNPKTIKNFTVENMSKILDSQVYDENDINISLSKETFAQNITEEKENFNNFDFDEFGKIFLVIEKIINNS